MRFAVLSLLLSGCAPKADPVQVLPEGPPSLVDEAMWAEASASFSQAADWVLAPLAQLDRGEVHALVVWPLFDPQGQVVDDDVVGLTVLADGSLGASNWRPDPRRISVELGGDDWRTRDRFVGTSQQELGQAAVSRLQTFQAARQAGDFSGGVLAAQEFSRLFALELVLDQTVTRMLSMEGDWEFVSRRPLVREAWFVFAVDGVPMEIFATPVDESQERWRFTTGS